MTKNKYQKWDERNKKLLTRVITRHLSFIIGAGAFKQKSLSSKNRPKFYWLAIIQFNPITPGEERGEGSVGDAPKMTIFVSIKRSVCSENFLEVHYMSVSQKLAMLKLCNSRD